MARETHIQTDTAGFSGTVSAEVLTSEYWNGRFKKAYKQFKNLADLADALAEEDPEYQKAAGVLLVQRIQAGRTNTKVTAKAVEIMERIRPVPRQVSSLLKRQKFKVD